MVLYFSGTGNSRYAAKRIAEISEDEVISINQRIKQSNYECVQSEKPFVFVGPVYAGRLPRIMEAYIQETNFYGSNRAYFIATCAETPWNTVEYINKLCRKKNFTLLGFNSIVMPQGYIVGGETKSVDANDKILDAAEPVIINIGEIIKKEQMLPDEKPGKSMMSKVLNPIMYSMMIGARKFYATDRCNGCGKCMERCPLNNIVLEHGKPIWHKDCTHCMACIAGCPTEAIEYGKKTKGKPRYYLDA